MPNSQNYKPTFILVGLNIAIYIYTSIIGGNFLTTNYEVIWNFGQVNGLILYEGYWWQLFTSMFIHVSIVHLAGRRLTRKPFIIGFHAAFGAISWSFRSHFWDVWCSNCLYSEILRSIDNRCINFWILSLTPKFR